MRYEEYVKIQLDKLKTAGLVDVDEMPDMDLYIDQAESFFAKQLEILDSPLAKRYLTKPMINNYAKNNMIARPDGKKYTKEHLIMIVMVAYLKGMFKMEEIELIMQPLVENYNSEYDDKIAPELVYNAAFGANDTFADKFAESIDMDITQIKKSLEDTDLADDERMEIFILILSLSMRADMERYLATRLLEKYFISPAKEKPEKIKKSRKSQEAKRRNNE